MGEGRARLSGLDGVRGLLALAILVAHTTGLLTPDTADALHLGLLAQSVIAFFALSGFLIFLPFCRALLADRPLPSIRTYARHRVARVYPAYLVIFVLANFALAAVFVENAWVAETERSDAGTGRLTDVGEVALHLTLGQTFFADHLQTGLNVAWTLTAEIGFYVLVPLLALAAAVLARRTGARAAVLAVPVGLMVLAGIASKLWIAHEMAGSGMDLQEATFGPRAIAVLTESTLTYADVFGFGMAACLVFVLIEKGSLTSWTGTRLWLFCTPVLLVSTAGALIAISQRSVFSSAFLAVTGGVCLVLITEPVARGRRSVLGDLLDVAPAKYLGKISLSFYLWHFPVLILVTRWGWFGADTVVGAAGAVALVTAITLVLGAATHRLVEKPAMDLGHHGFGPPRSGRVPVAIAHDYLTQRGGAERVVLAMARAFPGAPIYTTVYDPEGTYPEFADLDVRVTALDKVGVFRRRHRIALPFYAPVVSGTPIDADVVVASSSGWAHGFPTTGTSIVYCHSPAHWLYQGDDYLGARSATARVAIALLGRPLRWWDRRAAARADVYLANSTEVARRIEHHYGRSAEVVPAPVPERIGASSGDAATLIEPGYYLCVSRLLPYKHVDAVVDAFADDAGRRLVVVGTGPMEETLTERAGSNVTFLKDISDEVLTRLYRDARALIGVAYEDYGLTPIEAAASGTPCIVLRWGGYLDTMVEDVTATFVDEPTAAALRDGLARFESRSWDAGAIRTHAAAFTEEVFVERLRAIVERAGSAQPTSDG